jgi:catechol 2,3-dioxygenase-like lactoylglutathione lyase family enzyme
MLYLAAKAQGRGRAFRMLTARGGDIVLDHLMLTVRDIARSRDFYAKALAPLGYAVQMEFEQTCAFGPERKPCFWLKPGESPTRPIHLAFMARDRPAVDAFHAAALAAGATDNGAPGLREHYHPDYYGGFVIDPDGHNIEAVCHLAPGTLPEQAAVPVAGAPRKPVRKAAPKSVGKSAAKPTRKPVPVRRPAAKSAARPATKAAARPSRKGGKGR